MESSPIRHGLNTIDSLELVHETLTNLDNPAREEPMHKTIMDKFLGDTSQGIPSQGEFCAFPFFGNVGAPLMATLNILGLTIGLSVWLWTTMNVLNVLDVSYINTLFHGHQVVVDPLSCLSMKYNPSFSSSRESISNSKKKYKKNRKRKKKKRQREKPPTGASHVGGKKLVITIHSSDKQPTIVNHAGGQRPANASHSRGIDATDKSRQIGCKPKFPCKLRKGHHLTHLCLVIP
jgi:hypothetical protein